MKDLTLRLTCRNFAQRQRKLCKDPTVMIFISLYTSCCCLDVNVFPTSAHRYKSLWCCLIQFASEKLCRSGCRFWSESLDPMQRTLTWMDQERTDGSGIIRTPAQSNKENPQRLFQKRQKNLLKLERTVSISRRQTLLKTSRHSGVVQSPSEWFPLNPYHQTCLLISLSWPLSTPS